MKDKNLKEWAYLLQKAVCITSSSVAISLFLLFFVTTKDEKMLMYFINVALVTLTIIFFVAHNFCVTRIRHKRYAKNMIKNDKKVTK